MMVTEVIKKVAAKLDARLTQIRLTVSDCLAAFEFDKEAAYRMFDEDRDQKVAQIW